mmetsp:Transcript_18547/g.26010  ORF Transcript_18547/g.26010 Transcript_18547/m.26010 type:complete len:439 (+) Transcript_18547:2000-3316(+)
MDFWIISKKRCSGSSKKNFSEFHILWCRAFVNFSKKENPKAEECFDRALSGYMAIQLSERGSVCLALAAYIRSHKDKVPSPEKQEEELLNLSYCADGNLIALNELVKLLRGQGRNQEANDIIQGKYILNGPRTVDPGVKSFPPNDVIMQAITTSETTLHSVLDHVLYINDHHGKLLSMAVSEGAPYAVPVLLSRGADPKLKDEFGQVPLTIAITQKRMDAVRALIPYYTKGEMLEDRKVTPMTLCAQVCDFYSVARMIADNTEATDNDFFVALKENNPNVALALYKQQIDMKKLQMNADQQELFECVQAAWRYLNEDEVPQQLPAENVLATYIGALCDSKEKKLSSSVVKPHLLSRLRNAKLMEPFLASLTDGRCTRTVANHLQLVFQCYTCSVHSPFGCCISCAVHCHANKGHTLSVLPRSNRMCDCSSRTKCCGLI